MEETILETFDDVKFIQGATKMNQTHWQEYFGTALPNGIYDGLQVQDYYGLQVRELGGFPYESDIPVATFDYPNILTDGSVFVNGLLAQIRTEDGYTEIGRGENESDRFICIRVYLKEEKAQIIQKTGIAEFDSTASTYDRRTMHALNHFMADESYCCERNEYLWDVPIFYQAPFGSSSPYILSDGCSLRRIVSSTKKMLYPKIKYSGARYGSTTYSSGIILASESMVYNENAYRSGSFQDQSGIHDYYKAQIYTDNFNCPDGAIVRINGYSGATSDAITDITLNINQFTNTLFKTKTHNCGYGNNYIFDKSYDNQLSSLTFRVPTRQTITFRITYTGSIGVGGEYGDSEFWQSREYLVEVL